jgi:hypothetical protein
MNRETFLNLNTNMLIAGGVLAVAFLLYYIAFGKEGKTSKNKVKLAK